MPKVLLLNKLDIFPTKLQTTALQCCFPEYTGVPDPDAVSSYCAQRFMALDMHQWMLSGSSVLGE
ncbi:hypothetical protein B0H10DRAFT_2226829 [Mycena sp. CBHHK59/15]|nr:hypothetical protein B0H10DRAFT_2226829 [Mycena sp. CBHHK59/15]